MTSPTTEEGVRAMVAELDSAGDLPAGFGPLLERVPREQFIPDRIWVNRQPVDRAGEPGRWFREVYSDSSIVTQFDDGRAAWPDAGDRPTCSASMPSVVVGMLDALHVEPGHSVLEIGTGTGFNAALLSEIVGNKGKVTTIEIDPALARDANERLIKTGYGSVHTMVGDATFGADDAAPFDRIINTMAVPLGRIPYRWVKQTRPGGIIVTPVRADMTNGPLVRFTVHDDGTASGRTLPMGVAFMENRTDRTARAPLCGFNPEQDGTDERVTDVKPWPMLTLPSPRWALAVALPSCRYDIEPSSEHRPYKLAWVYDPLSDSWASAVPLCEGKYRIRQSGIRRLWDEAEAAYRWWTENGEPHITKWRWTITPDRQSTTVP